MSSFTRARVLVPHSHARAWSVPHAAVRTVARAPIFRRLPSKLSKTNSRTSRSLRVRPAVSTQEPVDVEDDADEMAVEDTASAKGPLRKGSKVTPEALRAFIRMRRGIFKITSFSPLASPPDVGGAVTSTTRRMVVHQCDTLERALESSLSERSEGWRGDELDPRKVPDASVAPAPDETLDVMFKHRLLLLQARKGYRCNSDSLVLAAHVAGQIPWSGVETKAGLFGHKKELHAPRIADLGAGAGVVGLSLAVRGGFAKDSVGPRVLLVENQVGLTRRCARNAALNGVGEGVTVCLGDVSAGTFQKEKSKNENLKTDEDEDDTEVTQRVRVQLNVEGDRVGVELEVNDEVNDEVSDERWAGADANAGDWIGNCDAVVCKPPHFPKEDIKRGTKPIRNEKRLAHYETTAGLDEFFAAGEKLLKPLTDASGPGSDPAMHMIYPSDRAGAVYAAATRVGLGRIYVREVFHDRDATEPKLVLVDARRSYVNNKGEPVSEEGEPIGESNTESDDGLTQFRRTPTYDLRVMDPLVLYDEVNETTGTTDPEASTYSEEIEWFMRRLPAPGP